MSDPFQSIIPIKNAKYHHLLYYEFSQSTNALYFPISSPLKTQTLISSFENKLNLCNIKMPDLFTEEAYIDLEDNRNLNFNINEEFSANIYAHKNNKSIKYGINDYLSLNTPDLIYKLAYCKESLNLIACKSNNIYIYDYTLYSQTSSTTLTAPCKTIKTENIGFGLDWEKYLVSTGLDKEIVFYDIYTDTENRYKTNSENSDIKNLEDLCVFIGDDRNLGLLDIRSSDITLHTLSSVGYSIDFSINNFIAVGMKGSSVLFDIRKLTGPIWEFHTDNKFMKDDVFSIVRLNPHTNLVLSVLTNGLVTIHDYGNNEIKYINDFQQTLHNADWNPLQFGEFVISGEINSTICLPSSLL